ncbi:MAG: hypothetical protein QE263_08040 [Vampirovibrionales bacterium]|nr:hypothetical protein [Vampirovibrionales bacterium]
MSRVKAEITATRKWLDANKDTIVEASKQQMKAKKEAAAGGAGNANGNSGNGQGAIPANSPISAQLAQLKGLLQMLPNSDPRKADLEVQIDQLTQWAAATGVGGATPNGTPTGNTAANPFATLMSGMLSQNGGAQSGNPFAALFAGLSAGLGPQQGANPQGNLFNPYGYQSSGYGPGYDGGHNAAMEQMMQLFQGVFAQQQQPPYR